MIVHHTKCVHTRTYIADVLAMMYGMYLDAMDN